MFPKNAYILLIDSDPESPRTLVDPLRQRNYQVVHTWSAREGMEKIFQSSPDLILLTRRLPDMNGLLLCAELKNDLVFRHIPLILIDFERIEGVSSDWILGHVRAGKKIVRQEIEDAGFEMVEEIDLFQDNYFLKFRRK